MKKKAAQVAADNFNKMSENPYKLSSMYGKMVVDQNTQVAKMYPWSRVEVSVPTDMKGATQNVQVGP